MEAQKRFNKMDKRVPALKDVKRRREPKHDVTADKAGVSWPLKTKNIEIQRGADKIRLH
jgi:hypothetical protein